MCCLLGSWVGARCSLDRVFLCSRKGRAPTQSTLSLQQSMAAEHTTPLCRHRPCAMSLEPRCSVTCARLESLTIVLKDCISAGEHQDRDKAPAPKICSVTQLDIWPSIRETARILWRDPHFGDFLHHGNAQRVHHTTADPKPVTVSSCTCAVIGTKLAGLSMCPPLNKVQTSAEKKPW